MTTTADFDLDAYCARIGYDGARATTLDVLRAIHALHPATIPFENLNPLLGIPVLLDLNSLQQKLVHGARGGYCYEHNTLLKHALETLGFNVTGLAARVVWNRPIETIAPRTHMLLLIELDGVRYIADVGFGGMTLTAPLRFELDTEQATPHEPYRLTRFEDDFVLESKIRGEWRALYRFDLQPQYLVDYEIASWYLSNKPESHFVTGLRVARSVPGRRYGLSNNELSIHETGTTSHSQTLTSAREIKTTLEDVFGIRVPEHPELEARLGKLIDE